MKRMLVVREADGVVINAVVIEPDSDYEPPEGHELLEQPSHNLAIGPGWRHTQVRKSWRWERPGTRENQGTTPPPDAVVLGEENP